MPSELQWKRSTNNFLQTVCITITVAAGPAHINCFATNFKGAVFVVLEILQAFHVGKVPTQIIAMSTVHANVTFFENSPQSNLSLAGHRKCFQQGLYTRPWNAGHLT